MSFANKYAEFKKKVKAFWKENKNEILFCGAVVGGSIVGYKIAKAMNSEPVVNYYHYEPTAKPVDICEEEPENDAWDEDHMRENWDWVCELASNMELQPGEEYHIYTNEFDVDGVPIGNNIVSHMVDGDEVYPDDCETYEEMYDNDDDSDEEDKEEGDTEHYVINLSDDATEEAKAVARKFAALGNLGVVRIEKE